MGLLTGHVALNMHLFVMKILNDLTCLAYGEEEAVYHFLGRYSFYMLLRYSISGVYLTQPENLRRLKMHTQVCS